MRDCRWSASGAIASALVFIACSASAQGEALQPDAAVSQPGKLNDEVVFLSRSLPLFDAKLETTLYRPAGTPPWPLVVINHGSLGLGNPHDQPRYRPTEIAAFFLSRGYLVAAPMRQGFSNSTGVYRWDCDHERYAERYAGDIAAVIDALVARGLAVADQVLVTGQSNGGMVALGYAADAGSRGPVARGVINFSGGINSTRPNCDWQGGMVSAARALGAKTRIPSLWIYTRNDAIFPPEVSRPFFDAYHAGQPRSRFVLYEAGDHGISNARGGAAIWGADVDRFLSEAGLPVLPRAIGKPVSR